LHGFAQIFLSVFAPLREIFFTPSRRDAIFPFSASLQAIHFPSLTDCTDCHRYFFASLRLCERFFSRQAAETLFFPSRHLYKPFIFFLSQIARIGTDISLRLCAFASQYFSLKKD
jgi:hypothetical protein